MKECASVGGVGVCIQEDGGGVGEVSVRLSVSHLFCFPRTLHYITCTVLYWHPATLLTSPAH